MSEEMIRLAVFRIEPRFCERHGIALEGWLELPQSAFEQVETFDVTRDGPVRPKKACLVHYLGSKYILRELRVYKSSSVPGESADIEYVRSIVLGEHCPSSPHEVLVDESYFYLDPHR